MESNQNERKLTREEKLERWLAAKTNTKLNNCNSSVTKVSAQKSFQRNRRSNSMTIDNDIYDVNTGDKHKENSVSDSVGRLPIEKRSRSLSEPPGSTRELIAELNHQNYVLTKAEKDLSDSFDRILKFKQDLYPQLNNLKNNCSTKDREVEYVDKSCQTASFDELLFEANALGHAKYSVMAFANDYMHQEIKQLKENIKSNKVKIAKQEKNYNNTINKCKAELALVEMELFRTKVKLGKLEAKDSVKNELPH